MILHTKVDDWQSIIQLNTLPINGVFQTLSEMLVFLIHNLHFLEV